MRGSILPGMIRRRRVRACGTRPCRPEEQVSRARRSKATPSPTSRSSAAGYTGLWTAYALKQADPVAADRRVRARDGRLRRLGSQRWVVLGAVRREPRRDRARGTDGTRSSRCNARCSRRSTRSSGSSSPRASTATGRAAARFRSRPFPRTCDAAARGARRPSVVGIRRRRLPRARRRPIQRGDRLPPEPGRAVHAALRRDPSGASSCAASRRGRAIGRDDLRAHGGRTRRTRAATYATRDGAGRGRRARDRGIHRRAPRAYAERSRPSTRS